MNQEARIMRKPEVLRVTGLSKSSLDREMRAARFPPSFKLVPNGRAVGWHSDAVAKWIASHLSG